VLQGLAEPGNLFAQLDIGFLLGGELSPGILETL
jgi:hypothetical protein